MAQELKYEFIQFQGNVKAENLGGYVANHYGIQIAHIVLSSETLLLSSYLKEQVLRPLEDTCFQSGGIKFKDPRVKNDNELPYIHRFFQVGNSLVQHRIQVTDEPKSGRYDSAIVSTAISHLPGTQHDVILSALENFYFKENRVTDPKKETALVISGHYPIVIDPL